MVSPDMLKPDGSIRLTTDQPSMAGLLRRGKEQDAEIIKLTREIAIEQCAQLAENWEPHDGVPTIGQLAAAIRKLGGE